jgi:hypothetical protein
LISHEKKQVDIDSFVTFNLNIGKHHNGHTKITKLKDLGFKESEMLTDEELQDRLNELWKKWIWNYIDGGAHLN